MGTLMDEMLSNWSYNQSSVLSAKRKLIELDAQLNRLDATFAWKLLAIGLCTVSNIEVGSDIAIGGLSMERSSVSAPTMTMNSPFLVPTTITSLINKRVRKNEDHVRKYSPLPVKLFDSTYYEHFHDGFPILKEVPPSLLLMRTSKLAQTSTSSI